jgi:gluconokinase
MLSCNSQRAPFANGHQNTAAMDTPERLSNGIQLNLRKHDYPKANHRHIWLITGPAGCGKTTVAEYIAKSLKLPFLEGDNVCSTATPPIAKSN